jgi:hypothetical protein
MIVCPLTGELNMSDGALNTSEAVWAKVQPWLQLQFTIFNFPLIMFV